MVNEIQSVIRIGIVDDHPLFREGVTTTLSGFTDFQIIGQGATADDAIAIAREKSPDVMLIDIGLPGDGLTASHKIAEAYPSIKVVVLTVTEDETTVKSALGCGVSGYIVKGVGGLELTNALRAVNAGARYVSPALAARIIARKPAPSECLLGLTERENEIATQVSRGLTNKEVARALFLSEKTVKHHMTRIMQKLGIRNRMELVLLASAKGALTDDRPVATSAVASRHN